MRKIICILLCAVMSATVDVRGAQNIERFEGSNGAWRWETFSERRNSIAIQNGQMIMSARRGSTLTRTQFPVDVTRDFRITARITIPEYHRRSGRPAFGMLFDTGVSGFTVTGANRRNKTMTLYLPPEEMTDEQIATLSSIQGGVVAVGLALDDNRVIQRQHDRLGLTQRNTVLFNVPERDVSVIIEIENRRGMISIDVNGIHVFAGVQHRFSTSNFGFAVAHGEIRIEEVIIHQLPLEQEW